MWRQNVSVKPYTLPYDGRYKYPVNILLYLTTIAPMKYSIAATALFTAIVTADQLGDELAQLPEGLVLSTSPQGPDATKYSQLNYAGQTVWMLTNEQDLTQYTDFLFNAGAAAGLAAGAPTDLGQAADAGAIATADAANAPISTDAVGHTDKTAPPANTNGGVGTTDKSPPSAKTDSGVGTTDHPPPAVVTSTSHTTETVCTHVTCQQQQQPPVIGVQEGPRPNGSSPAVQQWEGAGSFTGVAFGAVAAAAVLML